jgi:hypothetical protein
MPCRSNGKYRGVDQGKVGVYIPKHMPSRFPHGVKAGREEYANAACYLHSVDYPRIRDPTLISAIKFAIVGL